MPLAALGSSWAPRLEKAAAGLLRPQDHPTGLRFEQATPRLCRYLDLLVAWNRRVDLTAARSEDELVDLVLCDALMIAAEVIGAAPRRWVDVGSGAGAPALPIAVLCPHIEFTLVEPKTKRVAFLRTSIGALALDNVAVTRTRSDALRERRFEVALSRATLAPDKWLAEGSRLATQQVWVLLARGEAPSLEGWHLACARDYRWTLTGAERRLLCYETSSS